jgi:hypothetical protein
MVSRPSESNGRAPGEKAHPVVNPGHRTAFLIVGTGFDGAR